MRNVAANLDKKSGLHCVWGRLGLPELSLAPFPTDAANRIRRSQIRGAIAQMRVMLLGNTIFAPAMAFQAWGTDQGYAALGWGVVMVALSWWWFFSWTKQMNTDGNAADMRRFVRQVFVNGLMWSIGMALTYPVVDGDQKAVVTTIIVGSLALGTVGFSRAPAAAFCYLGIQTLCNAAIGLSVGIVSGSGTDLLIGFLSLAAGVSVFNATVERAKAALRTFHDHERLAHKSEVIDLLLKDYEEQATEWLWETDARGAIVSAPQQVLEMLRLTGMPPGTALLLDEIRANTTLDCEPDLKRLSAAIEHRTDFHDVAFSLTDQITGELRWISMRGRPQVSGETFTGFRGIFADATATIQANRNAEYLATHDGLTGLFNRNTVQMHLSSLVPNRDMAMGILIDLDGFKQVNDSYGHGIGDLLLQQVAQRLRNQLSSSELIARLGGDEFLILAKLATEEEQSTLVTFCERLVRVLSAPYIIDQFEISVSASIGMARFPQDTPIGKDILLQADLALYEAKNGGRNQCRMFRGEMQLKMQERLLVTERLKKAIQSEQVVPYYQPQYSLETGTLVGFEALARWTDSELGVIGPDVFVPIAEQTGLIVELGEQLMRQACRDALKWDEANGDGPPPLVSVNLSPVQFGRVDVTEMVTRVLRDTGLPAHRLEIEITESVLITDTDKIAGKLRELSEMRVTVALDDFGTGYSSLSYLKSLPLNRLKIDRSFISDLHEPSAQPIVNTIIQLGKNLGLSVIAEGVETQVQMNILSRMGCHDAQGYFFSRPAPAHEVLERMIQSRMLAESKSG